MHQSRLIRFGSISFLIGVFIASVLPHGWAGTLAPPLLLAAFLCCIATVFIPRNLLLPAVVCCAAGFFLFQGRLAALSVPVTTEQDFAGMVRFADHIANSQRLTVLLEQATTRTRVFVYVYRYPLIEVGSRISFRCSLQRVQRMGSFAFDMYAAARGVTALCRYPLIKGVARTRSAYGGLFALKDFISAQFSRALPEPEHGFVQAIILNHGSELSPEVRENFAKTGLTHVISISGLHMSLLVVAVEAMLVFFGAGRRLRVVVVMLLVSGYLILLGFPAPAVRSAIMSIFFIGAKLVGRPYDGWHVLVLVAAIMVAMNPFILVFDIGFQLSFLALAGISLTSGFFRHLLSWLPTRFGLQEVVAVTLAAQTLLWPLSAYYFQVVSLIAPLANVAIIMLLVPLMVLAFLLPLFSLLPPAYLFISWPLFFLVKLMLAIAATSARIPFAFVTLALPLWSMLLSYLLIAGAVLWYRLQQRHSGLRT